MLRDMDEQSFRAVVRPTWQDLYSAALLELDPAELSEKIDVANSAIHQRLCELASGASRSGSERQAMVDALRTLRAIQGIKSGCPVNTAPPEPHRIELGGVA